MTKSNKDEKSNVTVAILPAIILALAGLIGSFLSYKAGIATIQIPLNATQTAEARQSLVTGTPPVSPTMNNPANVPIAIDSTVALQPTGIFVTEGDVVNIKVVGGKWTVYRTAFPDEVRNELSPEAQEKIVPEIWMNPWKETDGTGSDTPCATEDECPINNYNLGALIARIGATYYTVGNKCSFVATETGQIFLQINENESRLATNFGVLAVDITAGNFELSPNTTNCGMPFPL